MPRQGRAQSRGVGGVKGAGARARAGAGAGPREILRKRQATQCANNEPSEENEPAKYGQTR